MPRRSQRGCSIHERPSARFEIERWHEVPSRLRVHISVLQRRAPRFRLRVGPQLAGLHQREGRVLMLAFLKIRLRHDKLRQRQRRARFGRVSAKAARDRLKL